MKKSVVITAFIVGILSAVVLVTGWPSLLETQKRDEKIRNNPIGLLLS